MDASVRCTFWSSFSRSFTSLQVMVFMFDVIGVDIVQQHPSRPFFILLFFEMKGEPGFANAFKFYFFVDIFDRVSKFPKQRQYTRGCKGKQKNWEMLWISAIVCDLRPAGLI